MQSPTPRPSSTTPPSSVPVLTAAVRSWSSVKTLVASTPTPSSQDLKRESTSTLAVRTVQPSNPVRTQKHASLLGTSHWRPTSTTTSQVPPTSLVSLPLEIAMVQMLTSRATLPPHSPPQAAPLKTLNWQVSPEWKEPLWTPALPRTVPHTPALLRCQPMMFSTVPSPTRAHSVQLTGLDPGPRLVPATLVTYSHLLPAPCMWNQTSPPTQHGAAPTPTFLLI